MAEAGEKILYDTIYTFSDIHGDINNLIINLRDNAKVIKKKADCGKKPLKYNQDVYDTDLTRLMILSVDDKKYIPDLNYEWIGENKLVVIVGDTIDNYRIGSYMDGVTQIHGEYIHEEYKIFLFLNEMKKQARRNNSNIEVLYGNHELMNLLDKNKKDLLDKYNYISPYAIQNQFKFMKQDITRLNLFKLSENKGLELNIGVRLFLELDMKVIYVYKGYVFVHGGLLNKMSINFNNYKQTNDTFNNLLKRQNVNGLNKIDKGNDIYEILWNRNYSELSEPAAPSPSTPAAASSTPTPAAASPPTPAAAASPPTSPSTPAAASPSTPAAASPPTPAAASPPTPTPTPAAASLPTPAAASLPTPAAATAPTPAAATAPAAASPPTPTTLTDIYESAKLCLELKTSLENFCHKQENCPVTLVVGHCTNYTYYVVNNYPTCTFKKLKSGDGVYEEYEYTGDEKQDCGKFNDNVEENKYDAFRSTFESCKINDYDKDKKIRLIRVDNASSRAFYMEEIHKSIKKDDANLAKYIKGYLISRLPQLVKIEIKQDGDIVTNITSSLKNKLIHSPLGYTPDLISKINGLFPPNTK